MLRTNAFVVVASLIVVVPGVLAWQPAVSRAASHFSGPYGTVQPNTFSLLSEPVVRKELSVTDEQETQILGILDQMSDVPADAPGQDLDEKERLAKREAATKQSAAREEELKKLLTPRQLARLNQLEAQAWGAIVVMRPDIAKAVGLTEEQKQKIRQAWKPYPQPPHRRDLQGMPIEQRQKAIDQWHAEVKEKQAATLNVLSDEQRAKFSEFLGKVFAFPSPKAE